MPVGKKLMVVASVLAAGMGTALFFRKDASETTRGQAGLQEFPFGEQVERRAPSGGLSAARTGTSTMARGPVWRVPTATPAAIADRLKTGDGQPTFQRNVNPVGALMAPIEPEPSQHADDARRTADDAGFEPDEPAPLEHTIADGDTLAQLAELYLGDANLYLELFEYNQDILTTPELLPIGSVLKIPPRRPRSSPAADSGQREDPRPSDEGDIEPVPPIVPVEPRQSDESESTDD